MARPWFFVLLVLVGCLRAKAQTLLNRYVVFTFEERYKISPHGTKTYYWIQQADSVAAHPLRLAALFLNTYSKDNLDDICQGRPTDPFLVKESTVYEFPAEHLAARDSLQALLRQHRTRLQTIRKSWDNGQQAIIRVYATPVTGRFCVARLRRRQAEGEQYDGPLFVPFADFHFRPEPAGTQAVQHRWVGEDFSRIDYAIFPGMHFPK